MANRSTRLIIKNSIMPSQALPSSNILQGEGLVNLGDGILFFSGSTAGSPTWVPAGSSAPSSGYFEVGSNLYNLKIRNQITSYSGVSGTALNGLFLSGTSNGFVLAPISAIAGVDTYVTDFSYNDSNVLNLTQNQAGPTFNVLINKMSGLTVSGTLSATTANFGTENVTTLNATGATITTNNVGTENVTTLNATGATITTNNVGTENVTTLNATGATITTLNSTTLNATGGTITTLNSTTINGGSINVNNLTITGSATYNKTATGSTELVNYATLTAFSQNTDVYVTGNTLTAADNNTNTQSAVLSYHGTPIGGPYAITTQNTFTTGGTYSNSTKLITFKQNDGGAGYTVDLTAIDVNDTYVTGGTVTTAPSNNSINGVIGLKYNQDIPDGTYTLPFTDVFTTGFTYNPINNTFTLKDNSGNTFNQAFTTVSGLTFSNLTSGRVVYVGVGGLLTDEAGFEYEANNDKLIVGNLAVTNATSAATFGAGGVIIGTGGNYGTAGNGDLTVHGSLTVFGETISAFTSNLYVEDNNVTLNYNPTGDTTGASIGAGWTVQAGNGEVGGDVNLDIRNLYTLTGTTAGQVPAIPYTTEYNSSGTGYANRGWVTQLNDIVIRSTNVSTPNGVRVLAEFDVLDGGTY